jgi:hypothetical protein
MHLPGLLDEVHRRLVRERLAGLVAERHGGEHGSSSLGGHGRQRPGPADRQPPQQSLAGPASMTTGSRWSFARGTFLASGFCSTAITGTRRSRNSAQMRSPTWPNPTSPPAGLGRQRTCALDGRHRRPGLRRSLRVRCRGCRRDPSETAPELAGPEPDTNPPRRPRGVPRRGLGGGPPRARQSRSGGGRGAGSPAPRSTPDWRRMSDVSSGSTQRRLGRRWSPVAECPAARARPPRPAEAIRGRSARSRRPCRSGPPGHRVSRDRSARPAERPRLDRISGPGQWRRPAAPRRSGGRGPTRAAAVRARRES